MPIDWLEEARKLRVVDVWKPGNETGWVTPRVLYDRSVRHQGIVRAPALLRVDFWMDHGTVGSNTLRWWGEEGSINNGTFSLAHYLNPRDTTEYANGRVYDTSNVIFKMVPDGYGCNHTGPCINPIGNHNTLGLEYESRQNGVHDITDRQYIKGSLLYAYHSRAKRIRDAFRIPHGLVAIPWGRRTDPWAGLFDIGRSWVNVMGIRADQRVYQFWGLA